MRNDLRNDCGHPPVKGGVTPAQAGGAGGLNFENQPPARKLASPLDRGAAGASA
jgi:hypothetical protein